MFRSIAQILSFPLIYYYFIFFSGGIEIKEKFQFCRKVLGASAVCSVPLPGPCLRGSTVSFGTSRVHPLSLASTVEQGVSSRQEGLPDRSFQSLPGQAALRHAGQGVNLRPPPLKSLGAASSQIKLCHCICWHLHPVHDPIFADEICTPASASVSRR